MPGILGCQEEFVAVFISEHSPNLMTEAAAANYSELSVHIYHTTQCHIPEHNN
jgi:hypothetical protein